MKKAILLICQMAILLIAHFFVWGDTIIILGIAAILAQHFMSLRFTGWVSVAAYPITYWCAGIFDAPQAGNHYVFWYLSFIAVTFFAFFAELIVKSKKGQTST